MIKGEIAFQAFIRSYNYGISVATECGGTLVAEMWVLTAAQCYVYAEITLFQIDGTKLKGDMANTQQLGRDNWFVHPAYNAVTMEADVAMLRLHWPWDYNEFPDLPSQKFEDYTGGRFIVSGFGETEEGKTGILYRTGVRAIPNKYCREGQIKMGVDTICTTSAKDQASGACYGDQGGPLFRFKGEKREIIGIISGLYSVDNDCRGIDVNRYTRLSSFVPWVHNVMENN